MLRFYIKYVAPLRSPENVEYFEDFLTRTGSSVTFQPSFYDEGVTFGFIDGEGDALSKVLRLMEGRFSAARLDTLEWAGAAFHAFVPYHGPEDPEEPGYIAPENRQTWVSWMAHVGITVQEGDGIDCAKLYKYHLMKEIAKKKFYDDNDSIADLAKISMVFNVYKDEFTEAEATQWVQWVNTVKQIYTKDIAIAGAFKMVNQLVNSLQGYYTAKVALENATTLEEINAVTFE
jgi:hypothetical protein